MVDPVPFSEFMADALYGPTGFYTTGGRAGRRGDFITSPEVGPLFGAVVARFLDDEWHRIGRPDPFVVVDAGAGPGTLARSVLAAAPACSTAMRYVAVDVSESQRAQHPDGAESMASLPEGPFDGVIIANELLDNLPFRLAVFDDGWREAFVVELPDGRLVEQLSARLRPGAVGADGRRRARGASAAPEHSPGLGGGQRSIVCGPERWSSSTTPRRRPPGSPSVRGGSGCEPTEATSGAATIWPTPAARTSPRRLRSINCRLPTPFAARPSGCNSTASTSWSTRVSATGRPMPQTPTWRRSRCAAVSARPRPCWTPTASARSPCASGAVAADQSAARHASSARRVAPAYPPPNLIACTISGASWWSGTLDRQPAAKG